MTWALSSLESAPARDLLVGDEVDSALRELALATMASAQPGEIVELVLPAPQATPERLLELGSGPAVLWDSPQGPVASGLEAVEQIAVSGSGRFAELRRRADVIFQRLRTVTHPQAVAPPARFFGGFAFDVGAADGALWGGLGDGLFFLPRFTYSRPSAGAEATFCLRFRAEEVASFEERERLLDRVFELLAGLRLDPGSVSRPRRSLPPPVCLEDAEFTRRVADITAAIGEGAFEKIVAARQSSYSLGTRSEAAALLRRLSQGLKASIRFAFRTESCTFLGATPERLVRKSGLHVETEALAGSIDSRAAAEALLGSHKDLREHQLVVDDILLHLRPLCAHLETSPQPTVRELRDVLHLLTPIEGTLAAPHHVLELVEELHPTPAVGGVPTQAALDWIREHEAPRGWYAGPVGYFDRNGDGDFAVALRSCLLHGEEALLFAGAGIVADSDPELELLETELKRQALLAALLS